MLAEFKGKRNFRIMVLPDHATPVSLKTHTSDPVLFGIFGEGITPRGFLEYSEKEALKSDLQIDNGYELMEYFIKKAD
jgi:2,3-bisphosphoglycerate-independent phosphoglycerate mutase